MQKDYNMAFIKDVETSLATMFTLEQVNIISNIITKALYNYEITNRCTDVVVYDDENQRIIKRFGACLLIDGKSHKTVYQYIRSVNKLSETICKPLKEIGTYDIRFFLATEKDRGLSGRSLENTRANLSAFFQWMVNDELIEKNPISKLKPIKYHENIKLSFSDVEIDSIRSSCESLKERAIIEVLLSTGVRVSELVSLKLKDINFSNNSISIKHGKGDKERIVFTTDVCMTHLNKYLNSRKENGEYIFYNKNHSPIAVGGIRFLLKSISKKSGVQNVHPHRFRRTFATNLARRGMSIQDIKRLLGHSDINTTMTYVCTDNNKIKESYNKYIA